VLSFGANIYKIRITLEKEKSVYVAAFPVQTGLHQFLEQFYWDILTVFSPDLADRATIRLLVSDQS
jgi:hypothetical protein